MLNDRGWIRGAEPCRKSALGMGTTSDLLRSLWASCHYSFSSHRGDVGILHGPSSPPSTSTTTPPSAPAPEPLPLALNPLVARSLFGDEIFQQRQHFSYHGLCSRNSDVLIAGPDEAPNQGFSTPHCVNMARLVFAWNLARFVTMRHYFDYKEHSCAQTMPLNKPHPLINPPLNPALLPLPGSMTRILARQQPRWGSKQHSRPALYRHACLALSTCMPRSTDMHASPRSTDMHASLCSTDMHASLYSHACLDLSLCSTDMHASPRSTDMHASLCRCLG